MAAHARLFPPSGSSRWLACPASVHVEAGAERRDSIYSFEGTVAHLVREMVLSGWSELEDFVGKTIVSDPLEVVGDDGAKRVEQFSVLVTDEMIEYLRPGIELVRDMGGTLFVEHRTDLTFLIPECFGTLDAGIIRLAEKEVIINDLKYGAGVVVDAFQNTQLRIYGLGFWQNIASAYFDDPTEVTFRFIIDQPRAGGGDEWSCSYAELMAFGEEVRAAAQAALGPNPRYVPGEKQCFWCSGARKLTCADYVAFNMEMIGMKFDQFEASEPDLPDAVALSPEQRAFIVRHSDMFKKFLSTVYNITLDEALATGESGGLKAVEGRRGNRAFDDREKAEADLTALLGEEAFNKMLISPADAEKRLKKAKPAEWRALSENISQPPGRPILVPQDDPRPSLSIADKFE